MMEQKNLKAVYFIGIGGIGMSALARYFASLGSRVFGYDRTPTSLTSDLEKEGISIIFSDDEAAIDKDFLNYALGEILVVYTPAIPSNSKLLQYFTGNHYQPKKRSEILAFITKSNKVLAVAGTHGKTTTSCMLAHLLVHGGVPCNAFLGGISVNYQTNCLLNPVATYAVVEADEYDRSFLTLSPEAAIITSVDADHLDIYLTDGAIKEAFQLFGNKVSADGLVVLADGIAMETRAEQLTYGIDSGRLQARNVHVDSGQFVFEVWLDEVKIDRFRSPYPGRHNVLNTLAAMALARQTGLSWSAIAMGVATFKGVKRRFEVQINRENMIMIDDYAHHPTEISACIGAVRELYPGQRLTGVFQPHLYSRTRDFADDFARSLEALNELVLMEIYPAREEPIEGVSSSMLLDKIQMVNKILTTPSELVDEVLRLKPEVLLTMGAGDIDKMIAPLKDAFDE